MALNGVWERPILDGGRKIMRSFLINTTIRACTRQEPWFDRVHDIIFDWLVAGGVVGLAAYLSIFAATLWELWRKNVSGMYIFTACGAQYCDRASRRLLHSQSFGLRQCHELYSLWHRFGISHVADECGRECAADYSREFLPAKYVAHS